MKKQKLPKQLDDVLLDKLYGFCYARTNNVYEAQELCSDIIFALIKTSCSDGEITDLYPFIWKVARNVYADFSTKRKRHTDMFYGGNADEVLQSVADKEKENDNSELLVSVYRRIAFLTKVYREVMIGYYIDGLSVTEIATQQHTSENTVRQRLFTARQKIKSEVEEMTEIYNKPVALDKPNFVIWGTGTPAWGDPRSVCTRTFSEHILWLCRKKPSSASEIANELNVPTVYVEEELEILRKGENGEYGLLRRLNNGKYAINFILFDIGTMKEANDVYSEQLPKICNIILSYIEKHKAEYLAFPYLNKKVDINLVLWQQIFIFSQSFSENVKRILKEKYFSNISHTDRPFSVFGYVYNGRCYGSGWDGVEAQNICGFSDICLDNIYISRIQKHFDCGHNVSTDPQIQLALRTIEGLDITSLSVQEKEHAAKALECGYLYRDGNTLYTKILVCSLSDRDNLFSISKGLECGYFNEEAETIALKISELIKKSVPEYLRSDWELANRLANLPILDSVVEILISKGILTPPKNGIGAEGCWMSVSK